MRIVNVLLFVAACACLSGAYADNGADGILGVWLTADGKARVDITKQNEIYAGRIVWLQEQRYPADDKQGMGGKLKVDRENPDKSLHTRPIIGLPLVTRFRYAGDSVWEGGKIYDPESGSTYRCKLTLMPDGTLKVRGYLGIFWRTEVWKRVVMTPDAATVAPAGKPDRRL